MKKMRNFQCGHCNKRYSGLYSDNVITVPCECGKRAARVVSAAKYFSNTTGKSPSAR